MLALFQYPLNSMAGVELDGNQALNNVKAIMLWLQPSFVTNILITQNAQPKIKNWNIGSSWRMNSICSKYLNYQ